MKREVQLVQLEERREELLLQAKLPQPMLQGVEGEKLNTAFYSQVAQRMATEEATCVLSNADQADTG